MVIRESQFSARADVTRKVLRRTINLAFPQSFSLQARTLDVSQSGLTLMSPMQLIKGMICQVEFDIMLNGKMKKIRAVSKTRDCVCVGTEGFRANLRFLSIDTPSSRVISDWMNYPA